MKRIQILGAGFVTRKPYLILCTNATTRNIALNGEAKMEKTEGENLTGAKSCSKWAMVFSSAWVAILTILKAFKLVNLDITDIIYSGIAIVGMWSPTYLSIWLDKIKEIKFGGDK